MASNGKITLPFLHTLFASSQLEIITWLQEQKLMAKSYTCPSCDSDMSVTVCQPIIDGYCFCCYKCGVKRSVRKGTWFERSKLSVNDILLMAYFWAHKFPNNDIKRETGFADHTVVNWCTLCREVTFNTLMQNDIKLGGPNTIVDFDESKFEKTKRNKGKLLEGQCLFGGVERGSKKCFLYCVDDPTADTLCQIVEERILPGTTIYSDCWRAYNCLESSGFKSLTVNHSISFKDSLFKRNRQRSPFCNYHYLAEAMYRDQIPDEEDIFQRFIKDLSIIYPPQQKDT